MRLLDRYVVSEFLKFFILGLIAFVLIFTIVDLFEKVDKFIDKDVAVEVILQYYLFDAPNTIVLMTPVALLLSCFFSVGSLSRRNELLAIRSSGISIFRILLPLFLFGLANVGAILTVNELVVPYTNHIKISIWQERIEKKPTKSNKIWNLYYVGKKNSYYQIKSFDPAKKTMEKPTIIWKDLNDHIYQRLDADRAVWNGGWIFLDVYLRQIDGEGNELVSHHDTLCLPTIEEVPKDFEKLQKTPEEMNFRELRQYVEKLKKRGSDFVKDLVELYFKISFPFANFIIILFGAPLAASLRKTGFAVSFAISLFICFIYWGTIQTSRSMGQNGLLPPVAAAWLPNLIFLAGGFYLLYRIRRN